MLQSVELRERQYVLLLFERGHRGKTGNLRESRENSTTERSFLRATPERCPRILLVLTELELYRSALFAVFYKRDCVLSGFF